jgi:hypothetical protein
MERHDDENDDAARIGECETVSAHPVIVPENNSGTVRRDRIVQYLSCGACAARLSSRAIFAVEASCCLHGPRVEVPASPPLREFICSLDLKPAEKSFGSGFPTMFVRGGAVR